MLERKYSKEKKISYVEEFRKTNESINGFAKKNNIPVTTFRQWLQGSMVSGNKDLTFGKIEINNAPDTTLTPAPNANTITFASDGIRIELQKNFDKKLLQKIAQVLAHA